MLVGGAKGLVMLKKLALLGWNELFERGEKFAKRRHVIQRGSTRRLLWARSRI
jgi:hypothetical protein